MVSALSSAVVLLALAQDAGLGFARSQTDGGQCLFSANPWQLVYSENAAGYSGMPDGGAFAPIDAAYATWSNQATQCSDFVFQKGPLTNATTIAWNPSAPLNLIIFREQSCASVAPGGTGDPCWANQDCNDLYNCWQDDTSALALTTTTFDATTGQLLSASTEFNAADHAFGVVAVSCPSDAGAGTLTDIQGTMTHEIGHSIGLGHVQDPTSTMYAYAGANGGVCKRTLDNGTATGFCAIYPLGQPSPPCGPVSQFAQPVMGVTVLGCSAAEGSVGVLLALVAVLGLARRPRAD